MTMDNKTKEIINDLIDDKIIVIVGLVFISVALIFTGNSESIKLIDRILTILGSLAVGSALGKKAK